MFGAAILATEDGPSAAASATLVGDLEAPGYRLAQPQLWWPSGGVNPVQDFCPCPQLSEDVFI